MSPIPVLRYRLRAGSAPFFIVRGGVAHRVDRRARFAQAVSLCPPIRCTGGQFPQPCRDLPGASSGPQCPLSSSRGSISFRTPRTPGHRSRRPGGPYDEQPARDTHPPHRCDRYKICTAIYRPKGMHIRRLVSTCLLSRCQYSGSVRTGRPRRAAARASPSWVWAFSRTRSSSRAAWQVARPTMGGLAAQWSGRSV